jgi:hypothetical protein
LEGEYLLSFIEFEVGWWYVSKLTKTSASPFFPKRFKGLHYKPSDDYRRLGKSSSSGYHIDNNFSTAIPQNR